MPSKDAPSRIGKYEIVDTIGRGGMGTVYRAVQSSKNRMVALKTLPSEWAQDQDRIERFEREAEAIARIDHPNVVRILDQGHEDEVMYFAMEYVPGPTLAQVLASRRLSLHEAIRAFGKILKGLEAAHAKGIVHRDLTPSNILVSEDLQIVKLADFGLSRVQELTERQGTLATSAMSMGSLHYMAPEQAGDLRATDERSDIYSAGVILYEMLTGRVPIGRFNLPSQIDHDVPSEVDPLVLRCLASDPADRFQSVDDLGVALRSLEDRLRIDLVNELQGLSRSTSRMLRRGGRTLTQDGSKGPPWLWIGIGAVVVAAAIAGFAFLGSGGESTDGEHIAEASTAAENAAASGEVAPAPTAVAEDTDAAGAAGEGESSLPSGGEDGATAASSGAPPAAAAPGAPQVPASSTKQNARSPRETAPTASRPVAEQPAAGSSAAGEPAAPPAEAASASTATAGAGSDGAAQSLAIARDKLNAGLYAPTVEDVDALLQRNPNDSIVLPALELKARAQEAAGAPVEAMATLVEIESRFPDKAEAARACLKRAELSLQTSREDRLQLARTTYTEVVSKYPQSPEAPRALLARAKLERQQELVVNDAKLGEKTPTALITLRQLATAYPNAPANEEGLWLLGGLYEDHKHYGEAAAAFHQLAYDFRTTKHDAWWRAAQLYDRRLKDDEKALAAYAQVPSSSENYQAAQRKVRRLSD